MAKTVKSYWVAARGNPIWAGMAIWGPVVTATLVSLGRFLCKAPLWQVFAALVGISLIGFAAISGVSILIRQWPKKYQKWLANAVKITLLASVIVAWLGVFNYSSSQPRQSITVGGTGNIGQQVASNINNNYNYGPKRLTSTVAPNILADFRVMTFDPPYPPDTVIAGIHFEPRMLDVRFFLTIKDAPIKNLDLRVYLLNTSGQILGIEAVAQKTEFPGMTIVPVLGVPQPGVSSVTIINGGTNSTVPLGATTSLGTFRQSSSLWRIHCTELFENTTAEFVLMVDRPYRTKMIEGFIVQGTHEYDLNGETKVCHLEGIVKFDAVSPTAPGLNPKFARSNFMQSIPLRQNTN